jgi:glycosyltransferase involved in cell wall biosynthesis
MAELSASVVIVTRNRPQALAMSLPLILAQTRLPRQLVVVDSSDDPEPVASVVASLGQPAGLAVSLLRSPRGTSLQRNRGIDASTGDVILFPDDDSLLFPTMVERVMAVYEADAAGLVGGVTVAASAVSPLAPAAEAYAPKAHGSRVASLLADAYVYFENRVLPRPFALMAGEIGVASGLPPQLAGLGCHLACEQEGFRMTFRRTVFARHRFNEMLTNYALGEDKDISYAVARDWLIIELPEPLVFHHEFPGARHDGFRRGVVEVLNEAYIVCRHAPHGSAPRRAIRRHRVTLLAQTGLRARSGYQRARFRGTLAAGRGVGRLLDAEPARLDAEYAAAMREILGD